MSNRRKKKKQANYQKRGKTWTSDWFITWDEFFFRPITHRSIRKPKSSQITFDVWTKITRCLFLYLNGVGTYWYKFVRLSTLQTANRISISEDFLPLFFPPRQVLPKISPSVPILKVFTVHFSEIWNCFLRGYFCLRRGEDCWVLHYIIHHFYRLDPCWQIFSTNERARISTVIIKVYI